MTLHEVNIGARARASDGRDVGEIAKLIIHPDTNEVAGFLLKGGLFSVPKIVEVGFVEATGSDGIDLGLSGDEVDALPGFVHEQLLRMPGPLTFPAGIGGLADVIGSDDRWLMHGAGAGEIGGTGATPLYARRPIGHVETLNISNLPEDVVLISEGTDVIGLDGHKVGSVDEVILDDDRRVVGLMVRAGWLFKRDVELPISMVESITADHIRLNVLAEDADVYSGRRERPPSK
jgi:uncharacterized protein YrrD